MPFNIFSYQVKVLNLTSENFASIMAVLFGYSSHLSNSALQYHRLCWLGGCLCINTAGQAKQFAVAAGGPQQRQQQQPASLLQ